MTNYTADKSINNTARVTGILYLLLLPLGIFSMYAFSNIAVPGNAAATAHNILASESMFRLGIVGNLLLQVINIFAVLLLYKLFKLINKTMASLMVIFLLLGVPIAMLNELNHLAVLVLLSGSDYVARFTEGQLQTLESFFLDLHKQGINIACIFWGLWLFPMGYLVFKSGFLPKILGILLIIGCFGYLVDSFAVFLLPDNQVSIAMFTFWGEVLLPLWLLIKGVNIEQWQKHALESVSV